MYAKIFKREASAFIVISLLYLRKYFPNLFSRLRDGEFIGRL